MWLPSPSAHYPPCHHPSRKQAPPTSPKHSPQTAAHPHSPSACRVLGPHCAHTAHTPNPGSQTDVKMSPLPLGVQNQGQTGRN